MRICAELRLCIGFGRGQCSQLACEMRALEVECCACVLRQKCCRFYLLPDPAEQRLQGVGSDVSVALGQARKICIRDRRPNEEREAVVGTELRMRAG